MEKTYFVYRHVSPSGKVYVGITSKEKPEFRWNNGKNYRPSTYFYRAILKYGWDNIKHEILFSDVPESRAKNLEKDLIRHYKNLNISYNITEGGDGTHGYHHTKEAKEKMSKHRLTAYTEEERKMLSKIAGQHNKGNSYNRKKGYKRGPYKNCKKVFQYDLKGNLIASYDSATIAESVLGFKHNVIRSCLNGYHKTCKGFIFKYE